jgi:hypothetical protein
MHMKGPTPKPPSKRRRANPPASYGAATPITVPAASVQDRELGFDNPHPMVTRMWDALQTSAEARFFSVADWERARFELLYANSLLTSGKPIPGNAWAQVQHGLGDLLVSPAAKRRIGIELRPATPDRDEIAAVSMLGTYRDKLKPT